ncbi:hypothetical protein Tcan_06215 [Toxocara canis]|uniref:Uncharacterized protein n=1 Tax=Toxocara canis TaxID=6265 RepID=A0A0B2UXH9_TOXCA|nr:hypothetical protein Tcan_06215 [Toxocara canis]
MGALGQIISTKITCQSAINGKNGCTKQTISNTLIPILPKNISVTFCCCGTDLCNCNNWNPLSPQYCSPVAPTYKPSLGWLTKQSNPTPQSPLPSPSKAHIVRLSTDIIFIFSTLSTAMFDGVFNRL